VNKASAEEMTQRWNGVGLRLARKIVEVRETTGLFEDLYDLARVPSLRSQRFEQVTGLPWNAAYFKYRDMANEIIGSPKGEIPDIKQLAERFSQVSGFAGCMVIHEDGLVLAGKWDHPSANALGAFAPQMFKKIHKYVKPLRLGEMKAICFFVGHQPITVIHSSPIYFAAMHEADRLSKKQVAIAQALTIELGRRFSKSA
jgi:predicted regulator of Ras-like GTPase activity (Roadblock/LC7/MglB family)